MPPDPAIWTDSVAGAGVIWRHPRLEHGRFGAVHRFGELDSTNRVVSAAARAGVPDGLVVTADFQTAGRGRLGREWQAPAGTSLLVSVLLRPVVASVSVTDPISPTLFTMAASLAMAGAIDEVCGIETRIKWPNDLVVNGRKIAGVLAEAVGDSDGVHAVSVGIGVNVTPGALPAELVEIATSCEIEASRSIVRDDVLVAYLVGLDSRLSHVGSLLDEYRGRLSTLGRKVRVTLPGGDVVGIASGLDASGHLVLETSTGDVMTITAGDVVHLRAAID